MPSRLLIVDDEPKTVKFLRRGLEEHDFLVESCRDGLAGLAAAARGQHDLIILDVMLPQRDGWSILTELRQLGKHTPVLFLTAKDTLRDRVKGLQLGADDYLVKPFAFSELLARIQSILRRTATASSESTSIADMEIDLVQHRVLRGNERIELTPKEFALLALLLRHRSMPVSRATIAKEIWEMDHEGDSNVVDVHIRRLRAKIDDPFETKLIHTVRGVGYVLEHRA